MGQAAYSASKAGVIGMTLPIARDLAEHGIRVVSLAPGLFESGMSAGMPAKVSETIVNSLLFPPIAAVRLVGKLTHKDDSDDAMPSAPVNKVLETVFGLERGLIGRVPMPFGVSLVAVLRRPTT